ncbi:TetR/AcrR family transcriptional regulator [uncultured Robinsoniella sp.]|uniref:TetR/AcrR family transcriptional regulator n=1 Tax=uncultured Robinsoniella sp. TaxID=904190 RepID=UPI00374F0EE3
MQYTKGIQTQEHIFQIGKKLMYENGYKNTTISMIVDAANVPHGLVNYYYKKPDFAARLYIEYFSAIDQLLNAHVPSHIENELQFHILQMKIALTQIFKDPKTKAFYYEISKLNLAPKELHDSIRSLQVSALHKLNTVMHPDDYYLCAIAEYGAHKVLLDQLAEFQETDTRFERIVELISTISIRIAGLDPLIIEKNILTSRILFNQLDFSDIHMFSFNSEQ